MMFLLSHIADNKISGLLQLKFVTHNIKHNIRSRCEKRHLSIDSVLASNFIGVPITSSHFLAGQQKQYYHRSANTVNQAILYNDRLQDQPALISSNKIINFITRNFNTNTNTRNKSTSSIMNEKPFLPKKALILRKFSRLEFEKLCHANLTEEQLAKDLNQRGSDYDNLKNNDLVQKSCLKHIESALSRHNVEYITVDRFGYTDEKIDWADVVITSGGDGTFLMAASKVNSKEKPVIGVNSDPSKSVGHLCLNRQYSNNFDKVLELMKEGKYQWQYRQRLRVTLIGEAADEEPKDLNDIRCDLRGINQLFEQDDSQDAPLRCRWLKNSTPETTLFDHKSVSKLTRTIPTETSHKVENPMQVDSVDSRQFEVNTSSPFKTTDGKVVTKMRQLKARALNEVFLGETLSARVSYYELSVHNNRLTKMKSSGLTVCTGTGSTSWYYNINKLTEQQIKSIVEIINSVTRSDLVQPDNSELIGEITKKFNDTLTFGATEPMMAYSIRDPVDYVSTMAHDHRGYARRIEVRSRMQNACLVLDGCQFYPFNDGSYALIEMYDEDALKTLNLE